MAKKKQPANQPVPVVFAPVNDAVELAKYLRAALGDYLDAFGKGK